MDGSMKREKDEMERAGGGRKKRYEKPRLERVPLRPEEAVLGNCKIGGTAGPAAASCSTYVCSSLGS